MLTLTDIRKSFGSLEVIKGISLEVSEAEVVAIVGASGAGKSTLLNIMGTLEKPDSGSVRFAGTELTGLSDKALAEFRNRSIGFVFQFHQLLPEFTTAENVAMPAMIAGISRKEAIRKADSLLERLGLTDRRDHRPAQLSGGERQRAAVARALINEPRLVLADEPSGSLDSVNRRQLQQLFFDLRRDLGVAFAIVTHDESLAAGSDRTIRLADGLIVSDSRQEQSQADKNSPAKKPGKR